ncbi:MAG: 16S rRNA (guanine(527)-N(7))-methyltransferase RsmG [Bacillota bacterium]|jgi:16S rRNA (guanine527-N7)-methyltransferase
MDKWLEQQARASGVELDAAALQRFADYCRLLQEWNRKINLTTVIETAAVYENHFLDSLSVGLAGDLSRRQRLIDVGSGAGFPGLALAIAYPRLEVTLLESVAKKARFLQVAAESLGLSERVTVICARAEEAARQGSQRERYDWVVSRGVARLDILAEYCLPFLKIGGCFVAQKGPKAESEVDLAAAAIGTLGGQLEQVRHWELPGGAQRTLVVVRKVQATPSGYPRRTGVPAKRPLGDQR